MKKIIAASTTALLLIGGVSALGQMSAFAATTPTAGTTVSAPADMKEVQAGVDLGPNVQDQSGNQINQGGHDTTTSATDQKEGSKQPSKEASVDHGIDQGPNVQNQSGSQVSDGQPDGVGIGK